MQHLETLYNLLDDHIVVLIQFDTRFDSRQITLRFLQAAKFDTTVFLITTPYMYIIGKFEK